MTSTQTNKQTLAEYFEHWMTTFKQPFISPITYIKYQTTQQQISEYFGKTRLKDLTRLTYQNTLNTYAKNHSKPTTACFHKHIRAALLDAIDEQLLTTDPTRKAILTGRENPRKKSTYLNLSEWQKLTRHTRQIAPLNSHYLIIYLAAVTGMRFAEVLGLTWSDIDFENQQLSITKTWDYKYHTGFIPTKNKHSKRKVAIDRHTIELLKNHQATKKSRPAKNPNQLICTDQNGNLPANITINRLLIKICATCEIPTISFHALRHTHASILLFEGVNILSVSKRLGHHNVTTTQQTYLHIIQEMEDRETELILGVMEGIAN
ncbi:tyrosine-type recombinase/integrase [Listeria costaricensis]|uniref:tyrosine-type recombinase/integrase n=1 Tax=Listeria costaricensis TaxID=2026604 RepID=UPI000C0818D0|nr:site-specific integrase [Listeria costaricensis]